jgi:hypothetical protein
MRNEMAESGLAQRAPSGTVYATKLADHSSERRMLVLVAMALVAGTGTAAA